MRLPLFVLLLSSPVWAVLTTRQVEALYPAASSQQECVQKLFPSRALATQSGYARALRAIDILSGLFGSEADKTYLLTYSELLEALSALESADGGKDLA